MSSLGRLLQTYYVVQQALLPGHVEKGAVAAELFVVVVPSPHRKHLQNPSLALVKAITWQDLSKKGVLLQK